MTGEELAGKIKDEIGEDERLHAILDRIREGKATFTDSELYAAITARIAAQQMRRNVLSLDKREAAFVGITRERYTDTFTVFSAVQRILDAQNGIRIRPQEPGFDTGRARKIGHSLEDQTVPDSTIERRARSATENFCMSHHDDCVRVQAEFRARAGLQSYAIREGGAKCCDWCADVSGKYPANETPQGFWGRHDNCKCSILYESKRGGRQLLRGTSKKWEVVPENAGAEPLVRLTHEQAAAIRERNQLTVLTHEQAMTLQEKAQLHFLSEKGISGKHETRTSENTVDISILKTDEYKQKFKGITGNPAVDRQLYVQAVAQLTHRNGSYGEDLTLINGITGRVEGRQSKSESDNGVDYNSSLLDAIARNPAYSLISIHNHGTNNPPTGSDLAANGGRKYMLGVVVTHNGRVFTYKAGSTPFLSTSFDARVDKIRGQGYNEFDAIVEALNQYKEEYGIEWSER